MLRISAGLGLRIFRASGFPGLRAIRMLRITAGLRRRVFRISGFREIRILRISAALWLRFFRVSGFRSTRTLGSSAGLGLRVFRASEFRAIRMLGIARGSSLGFSGVIAIRMLDCWILSGILSGTTWLPGDTLYGFGRVWVLLFDTCQNGSIMILEGSCGVPF